MTGPRLRFSVRGPALLVGLAMLVAATAARAESFDALSRERQTALAPLRAQWDSLDPSRQQKWLEVADRFRSMPPEEQARLRERMAQWARLSPTERGQARLQFQEAQRWTPQERQERWAEYQSLHPDARKVLAERWKLQAQPTKDRDRSATQAKRNVIEPQNAPAAPRRPATPTTARALSGATTNLITAPPQALTGPQPGVPKIATSEAFVDPATLLPRRGAQGAAMVTPPASAPKRK